MGRGTNLSKCLWVSELNKQRGLETGKDEEGAP